MATIKGVRSVMFGVLLLYLGIIRIHKHHAGKSSSFLLKSGTFNISERPDEPQRAGTVGHAEFRPSSQ